MADLCSGDEGRKCRRKVVHRPASHLITGPGWRERLERAANAEAPIYWSKWRWPTLRGLRRTGNDRRANLLAPPRRPRRRCAESRTARRSWIWINRHCEEARRADEAIQERQSRCMFPWIASLRSQ